MGNHLLDTHTAIWFFNGDDMLSQIAKGTEDMTLITADGNIAQYKVPQVW